MECINYTEREKRELIVSCLDKNMFVEAGAGAGKTTLIVNRIIHQLKAGFKPREIVAITFTNAAARELRERIVKEVHKESAVFDLKEAMDTIDQMQISTIHSFCNRLLKERTLDANMPMELRLLEEDELSRLKEDSFLHFAESLKKADWEILLKAGKYRSNALSMLKSITDKIIGAAEDSAFTVSLPELTDVEFKTNAAPYIKYVKDQIIDNYNYVHQEAVMELSHIPEDKLSAYGKKLVAAILDGNEAAILDILIKVPTTNVYIIKIPSQKDLIDSKRADKKTAKSEVSKYTDEANKLRDYVENHLEFLNKILGGYENWLYSPYIEYAKKAAEYFFSQLPTGVLYNDLLISQTDRMVRDSAEAREYLAKKFRCIYVDEFQDTDHVQERLIRTICLDKNGQSLRDGALFVVGDPKQSIYRFRGAEPEVYFTVKDLLKDMDNAYVVELSDNYRSNDTIIDWVNKEFASKDITPGSPYIPMNGVKIVPDSLKSPELLLGVYRHKEPSENINATIESDAEAVKDLIFNLMCGNHVIVDYREDGTAYTRKIRYSDFLIMCATMPEMDVYADCLKRYSIPFVMDSKSDLSVNTFLMNFCKIYEYLVNPYVYEKRAAVSECLESLGMDNSIAEKILALLLVQTRDLTDISKLTYLKENLDLLLGVTEEYLETDLLDIETKITQMTELVIAKTPSNGISIARALRDYTGGKLEHQLVLNDQQNVVRFMNLHKAKGLEGNIVIWTNRQEKAVYHEGEYRVGNKVYPAIYTKIKDRDTCLWTGYNRDNKLRDAAIAADTAERIRLEYVACTRAKQVFIFMDRLDAKGEGLFTKGYALAELPSIETIVKERNNPSKFTEPIIEQLALKNSKKTSEESKKMVFTSHSPSEFEDENAGVKAKGARVRGKLNRPFGGVFGTTMHRSLELLVNRITLTKEQMDGAGLDAMGIIDAGYRQAINESLEDIPLEEVADYEAFIHEILLAFGKWWYASGMPAKVEKAYTELPFSYFYDDLSEGSVWMHGTADLVLKMKDNSYLIIDYKSDIDESYPNEAGFEERLRGKYVKQIEAYKKAISRVFAVPEENIKAEIVSFSQKDLRGSEKLRVRVTEIVQTS